MKKVYWKAILKICGIVILLLIIVLSLGNFVGIQRLQGSWETNDIKAQSKIEIFGSDLGGWNSRGFVFFDCQYSLSPTPFQYVYVIDGDEMTVKENFIKLFATEEAGNTNIKYEKVSNQNGWFAIPSLWFFLVSCFGLFLLIVSSVVRKKKNEK